MRYLLIFQFSERYFATHAELVAFEDRLRAALPSTHEVDGHDVGSGTTNFFVFTDAPLAAHARFRKYLGTNAVERNVRVSFREMKGDDFQNLWPRRDSRPFAIMYPEGMDPFSPVSKRAIPKRSKPGVSKVVTKADPMPHAKNRTAKKTPAKKTPAKKTPAKKTAAKKTPARKTANKKSR
jgi:hypothetical protein